MAKPKNPKLRQRLAREHHEARKEERLHKEQARFIEPPTGRQARGQARAYANVEYNPTIRGIREEEASLGKQAQQANQWYNQLGAEQAHAAQGEIANANQFASSLTQQLAQANNQNAAYLASQQQAMAQQSALTGQPMAPSSGQAAAAGANIGAQEAVALNAPTLGAAYNQAGLTNRLGLASRERGRETAQGLLGERKKVQQDLRSALKQKGQAYVGRLGELRESARKAQLDKEAFNLEGQQAAAQQKAEQEKIRQDEIQSKRSAATSRENSERTAASSAASTAASLKSANASGRNARVNEEELREERAYKRAHHGMTPSEVAAARKENQRNPIEKREKQEEAKTAFQTATRVYNLLKNSKEFQTLHPEEQWALLEEAVAKRGVEGPLVAKAVERIKAGAQAENIGKTATGLGGL